MSTPSGARRRSIRSRLRRIGRHAAGRPRDAAYVVFNEQLWHPLLRSQVLDLLTRLRPRLDVDALYLLAFMPSRDVAAHRQELDDVRAELGRAGVILDVRSLLPVPRPRPPFTPVWGIWTPHESRRAMPLAACLVALAVVSLRLRGRVTVFHARSYPAAAAVAPSARLVGAKLIFDTRSPFPEENVVAGRWTDGSSDFVYWKRIERRLLRHATTTVAIAPPHEEHLRQIEPTARTIAIPNNADVERFAAAAPERCGARQSLGVGPDEVLLCYLGSLNRTWNNPDIYARFFHDFAGWRRPYRLLFVVPQGDHPLVRSALATAALEDGPHYLLVHATPTEVPHWLAGADIGLQLFASPDTRVGVKVVEYLAAGLPVVTNRNVQGAAALVEETGVGLVVDDAGEAVVARIEEMVLRRADLRERCLALARSRFSTDRIAEQYAAVYHELLTR